MRVAFIGLGAMGRPMAGRLLDAGFSMTLWNRTPDRTDELARHGATVAATPTEAAKEADVVIVMVTDDTALAAVADEAILLLPPDGLLINMSTVSGDATLRLHRLLGDRFVDAPVSGTIGPAARGELVILAGGSDEALDKAEPLFAVMGKKTIRCGPVGAGTAMKQGVNLLLAGMMTAYAEATALIRAEGVSFDDFRDAVASGAMGAPMFAVKGEAIAKGDFTKTFPIDLVHKDLGLILDTARSVGVSLPVATTLRARFDEAMDEGLGDEDVAAIVKICLPDRLRLPD